MNHRSPPLLALLLLTLSQPAMAEREHVIDSGRIYLGELVPNLSEQTKSLDLGAAPKPGSSRVLGVTELNRALSDAGDSRKVTESIRVVRSSKRWSQQALIDWVTPAISSKLPSFATLVHLDAPLALITPTTVDIGNIAIAQLPVRLGSVKTSIVVDLVVGGQLEQRISLPVTLDLRERPKAEQVVRGDTITVSIHLGRTEITAPAIAIQSADVGQFVLCRVLRTKKVLRVKLVTKTLAEVVPE